MNNTTQGGKKRKTNVPTWGRMWWLKVLESTAEACTWVLLWVDGFEVLLLYALMPTETVIPIITHLIVPVSAFLILFAVVHEVRWRNRYMDLSWMNEEECLARMRIHGPWYATLLWKNPVSVTLRLVRVLYKFVRKRVRRIRR